MKSLSEIRRNIVSFYSTLQNKVTDFSVGSVVSGIFYAVSASLERVYSQITEIERQAYIATATGTYLDKLIDGTFQLKRTSATRNFGYVTIYANSPLPESVVLNYADLDENENFTGGLTASTKFLAYTEEGGEGIVYTLTKPKNTNVNVDTTARTITLPAGTQYAVLPVASSLRGSQVRISEGDLYSFPASPPGISGVLNTLNPGLIFFSTEEYTGGAPFSSRFTTLRGYNNATSAFTVDNAFNFSKSGIIEIEKDIVGNEIVATYSDGQGNNLSAGIIFDYIDSSVSSITLKQPIVNSAEILPNTSVVIDGEVKTLTLSSYTYQGTTVTGTAATLLGGLNTLFSNPSTDFVVKQRKSQITPELIFDPDTQLTEDYALLSTAAISGASDASTDEQYRESLRSYLNGLGRATKSSLIAGALQVPGVSFASVLPDFLSPKGSATVVASDADGFLQPNIRTAILDTLEEEWKAAGINLIVRAPERIPVNVSVSVKRQADISEATITNSIIDVTETYINSLSPGNTLSYSALLSSYNALSGIENVFNLVLTRQLTDITYTANKAAYDEKAVLELTNTSIVEYTTGDPLYDQLYSPTPSISPTVGSIIVESSGTFIEVADASTYDSTYSDTAVYTPVGVVHTVSGSIIELLEGSSSITLTYNVRNDIFSSSVNSVDTFKNAILTYRNDFPGTSEDFIYFISYILGETIDANILASYPVDPELVLSENIQDFSAEPIEIYRTNTFITTSEVRTLVGINYL